MNYTKLNRKRLSGSAMSETVIIVALISLSGLTAVQVFGQTAASIISPSLEHAEFSPREPTLLVSDRNDLGELTFDDWRGVLDGQLLEDRVSDILAARYPSLFLQFQTLGDDLDRLQMAATYCKTQSCGEALVRALLERTPPLISNLGYCSHHDCHAFVSQTKVHPVASQLTEPALRNLLKYLPENDLRDVMSRVGASGPTFQSGLPEVELADSLTDFCVARACTEDLALSVFLEVPEYNIMATQGTLPIHAPPSHRVDTPLMEQEFTEREVEKLLSELFEPAEIEAMLVDLGLDPFIGPIESSAEGASEVVSYCKRRGCSGLLEKAVIDASSE